jgi:hypothetical protein
VTGYHRPTPVAQKRDHLEMSKLQSS